MTEQLRFWFRWATFVWRVRVSPLRFAGDPRVTTLEAILTLGDGLNPKTFAEKVTLTGYNAKNPPRRSEFVPREAITRPVFGAVLLLWLRISNPAGICLLRCHYEVKPTRA